MSDEIGHHCGIAMIRLKKPLSYFNEKYGSPLWAFNQLFLLMEKQHNRGQDGAGIGSMKLNMPVGESFMFRGAQHQFQSIDQDIWFSTQGTRKNDQKGPGVL